MNADFAKGSKFILTAIMIALAAGPAFAQFYQYTDKNGNTVITDTPPHDAESREVKMSGDRVFRSNKSARDYPSYDSKSRMGGPKPDEPRKKDYSRVSVVMYMTDW